MSFLKTSIQTAHDIFAKQCKEMMTTSYSSVKPISLPHWLLLPTGIRETEMKLFVPLVLRFSKGIVCFWDSFLGN